MSGSYRSLFGRKGFAALLSAQFLGAFNDNFYKMVVSLLALGVGFEDGGAGGYLSLTGAVFILPYILFSGYADFVADAYAKRGVLVAAKLAEILIMAFTLVALLSGRLEWLLATLFLLAVQSVFFSPAKYGILPEMLPATALSRANGLMESSRYIAIILGSVAGGAALSLWSDRPGLIGTGLLAVAGLGALASLGIHPTRVSVSRKRFFANPWAEIATGVRRLAGDRRLGPIVVGTTYFYFMASLVMLDLLLVSKEVAGLDDLRTSSLGAFVVVGLGLGSIAAGRLSGTRVELGLVPLGALGIAGLLGALACVAEPYGALAVLVAVPGFFGGLYLVPLYTALQHFAGEGERGHLIATNNFLNMSGVLLSCAVLWVLHDLLQVTPDRILLISGLATLGLTVCLLGALSEYRGVFSCLVAACRRPPGGPRVTTTVDRDFRAPGC